MQYNNPKINNKVKQKYGGNWGHPRPFTKKHTHIPKQVYPEKTRHQKYKKKKTKKEKKHISYTWNACPFCRIELPVDEKKVDMEVAKKGYCVFKPRVTKCLECGAYETDCPACHQKTWRQGNNFRHKWHGCGFIGPVKENQK